MINLKAFLLDNDLSVEQYFLLHLFETDVDYLQKYFNKIKNKTDRISIFQDLLLKGFITLKDIDDGYSLENIIVVKSINTIANEHGLNKELENIIDALPSDFENKWKELLSLYPKLVNGRPLHNLKEKNKLKYLRYLKTGTLHSDVIKGLTAEISARENARLRKQFFPEWQLLSTYINNKSWEQFLDIYPEITENKTLIFGSDGRITRTF